MIWCSTASDNFATRLAVSDACVELGIPLVSAAAVQFQGQVGLFRGRPCFRCFVGDAFDSDECDNCAELGVLGALTLTIGGFAALLAIRALAEMSRRRRQIAFARRRQSSVAGYSAAGRSRLPDCVERLCNPADEMRRDRFLGRLLPVFDALGGHQPHLVVRAAHDIARHVVGDDPVGALGLALGGGIGGEVVGFGGEADEQGGPQRVASEGCEDVGVGLKSRRGRAVGLLELGG